MTNKITETLIGDLIKCANSDGHDDLDCPSISTKKAKARLLAHITAPSHASHWPTLEPLHLLSLTCAYEQGFGWGLEGRGRDRNPYATHGSQAAAWDRGYVEGERRAARDGATITDGLIEAAEAVVARWDTPLWKDAAPTADFIARLRREVEAAKAQPGERPSPCARHCEANAFRIEIRRLNARLQEQHAECLRLRGLQCVAG